MSANRKAMAGLARRIAAWESIPANGVVGNHTKLVRRHDGHTSVAYRRPGSQNRKKG